MASQSRDASRTTTLTIGQVVETLSGEYPDVSHSSLRFLEREGLIRPTRTPGGHRTFTEDDVRRIRQIKEWQRRHLSLSEIRSRLEQADRLADPAHLASEFLEHAVSGRLQMAQRLVLEADSLGTPLETIFQDILKQALYELGDRWQAGILAVGQEKEVTALTRDLIAELSLRHAVDPWHDDLIVAACVTGEYHELGLRMVTGILQSRGYAMHYLGPNVDPTFLMQVIQLRHPSIVLLTATLERHIPAVHEAIDRIVSSNVNGGEPRVVVGGQVLRDHRDELVRDDLTLPRDDDINDIVDCVLRNLDGE